MDQDFSPFRKEQPAVAIILAPYRFPLHNQKPKILFFLDFQNFLPRHSSIFLALSPNVFWPRLDLNLSTPACPFRIKENRSNMLTPLPCPSHLYQTIWKYGQK